MAEYLTTKELAALLRIKERKVYDLAAAGDVPCSRATGKLLFPRRAVEAWLARNGSGYDYDPAATSGPPNVVIGSHDPLLDWAIRESGCGLATFFDGSSDGLDRFASGEGMASGLHLVDAASGEWNRPAVEARFANAPIVLLEWAWRERGLIIELGNTKQIKSLQDLHQCRFAPRQAGAGSQALFDTMLHDAGICSADIETITPVRTENDAALAVLEGKADVAFGLRALAVQYRLEFVPLVKERFDLLVHRRSWFEPPFQCLLEFCTSEHFQARAAEMNGYDISGLGRIHFNGAG